ncbi:MAG: nitroreductase/quinone reductase family protein [Pseudomonadales bacterium]
MTQFDYVKTRREDVKVIPPEQAKTARKFVKWYTRFNIWVFKKSNGRLMKNFPGGYPICVVGTKGAKTGKRREIALIHLPIENDVLLVASQGGMPFNPFWYYNVTAYPEVDVLFQGEVRHLKARRVSDDEKRELWPHLLSLYPDFDAYQAKTDRNIPVFRCSE